MLTSKLWHNKTETKIVKIAKMVEFIKTYNQYPCKFNFCHFVSSIIRPPFWWVKNRFSENPAWKKWEIFTSAWGRVLLRGISCNNLNTKNLKLLQPWGIYRFEKKIQEIFWRDKPISSPLWSHSIGGWRKFHANPVCFFIVFCWQKIAFKSSWHVLSSLCYWILLICPATIQNWEKIYTKTVVDVSKGAGERVFLFFWERLKWGLVGNYYF